MTKRGLTAITAFMKIALADKTQAGSAAVQPARDSRLKATNCRLGGSHSPAILFYVPRQFRALLCLKKPYKIVPPKADSIPAQGRKSLITVKWICPIHAEPVHSGNGAVERNQG